MIFDPIFHHIFFNTMNDKTCPALFEQLPVEIFLQVFASLTLQDIIRAFSGLNSHIESCIHATRNAIYTLHDRLTRTTDPLRSYPIQIGRLIITNCREIDFTSLIYLRSLTLKYGTGEQFDAIRPQNFPQLEILHLHGGRWLKPII